MNKILHNTHGRMFAHFTFAITYLIPTCVRLPVLFCH